MLIADRTHTDGDTTRADTVPGVYTRGLTETVDLFAGIGYSRIPVRVSGTNAIGIGNPSLGAKWRCYENTENRTSLVIKPEILFSVSATHDRLPVGAEHIAV